MGFSYELHGGLYTQLAASVDLVALVGNRIYDNVPQDEFFPYVVISDQGLVDWGAQGWQGFATSLRINSFSRKENYDEVRQIQDAIYDALHEKPIPVNGYDTIITRFEAFDMFQDPDGYTRQGSHRFNMLVNNNAC